MGSPSEENAVRTGLIAAIFAYLWWGGVLPVFLLILRDVSPDQVLVHRILWSVPLGAVILSLRKQWPEVRIALADRKVLLALLGSSAFIAVNWLVYIWAFQNQRIFEAALGYYINPLVYMIVGVLVLNEKLSRAQLVAVLLAGIGVAILTLYGGRFPTVSLILAVSFTFYGYLRKQTPVGAMPGLFIETILLSPLALGWLWFFEPMGEAAWGQSASLTFLLILAGPMTVLPLLAFAIGARRLPLSTIGFLQFIGPTLQFIVGLIDGEPFTLAHQLCFAFIWGAVVLYAWEAVRQAAASRREAQLQTAEKQRGA